MWQVECSHLVLMKLWHHLALMINLSISHTHKTPFLRILIGNGQRCDFHAHVAIHLGLLHCFPKTFAGPLRSLKLFYQTWN